MSARITLAACAFTAVLFAGAPGAASGFLVYDLSGEAIGRASAVTADISEPSAVWFNPAALTTLDGVNLSVGGVLVSARARFENAESGRETESDRGTYVLPTFFGHAEITERVSLGLGVYSAFGIGVRWPRDWEGREHAIGASLQTIAFNPSAALRVDERLSVGVGFDAVRGTVDFENGLPSIVGGSVRLAGGAWGWGFNAGALYRAIPDRVHLALTYRSRVELEFDGRADFDPENPDFARGLPDEGGTAEITLPDILTAGVAVRPVPQLSLGLDLNAVFWSTYDRVDIDFESAPDRALNPNGRDTVLVRLGADWETPTPGVHLRTGLIFDRSAIPPEGISPALPDSDRIDVAAGIGYEQSRWSADLGYLLVIFLPAEAKSGRESPEGTYHSVAHLLGLTVGASF